MTILPHLGPCELQHASQLTCLVWCLSHVSEGLESRAALANAILRTASLPEVLRAGLLGARRAGLRVAWHAMTAAGLEPPTALQVAVELQQMGVGGAEDGSALWWWDSAWVERVLSGPCHAEAPHPVKAPPLTGVLGEQVHKWAELAVARQHTGAAGALGSGRTLGLSCAAPQSATVWPRPCWGSMRCRYALGTAPLQQSNCARSYLSSPPCPATSSNREHQLLPLQPLRLCV